MKAQDWLFYYFEEDLLKESVSKALNSPFTKSGNSTLNMYYEYSKS